MSRSTLIIMGIFVLMAGCAKRQIVKPVEEKPVVQEVQTKDEPSIRYSDWTAVPDIKTAFFDYDKADLTADAREILKANAEYLKSNESFNVIVEGNTDERGTTEYNLALGQRRAMAVREYYGQLGVALGRVGTISYGEEKPFDQGHDEAAWSKNRRADTKVRSAK